MADKGNKFDCNLSGSLGDSDPYDHSTNDQVEDFAHDSAGVPNPNMGEMTSMNMDLPGNKYPHQTGHDSMSNEDLYYT